MTSARTTCLLPILTLCGCLDAPGWANFPLPTSSATEADSSSSSSGDEQTPPTTSDGVLTTTFDVMSTSSTGDTTEAAGTTEAALDPQIVGHIVEPDPLDLAGPIAVSVATEHADGVRMQVDDQAPVELEPVGQGIFAGEILMLSALSNGTHAATFTAWRDALESEEVMVGFEVALPKMGKEAVWDSGALIGKGTVAALAAGPGSDVLEFGTLNLAGDAHCYPCVAAISAAGGATTI